MRNALLILGGAALALFVTAFTGNPFGNLEAALQKIQMGTTAVPGAEINVFTSLDASIIAMTNEYKNMQTTRGSPDMIITKIKDTQSKMQIRSKKLDQLNLQITSSPVYTPVACARDSSDICPAAAAGCTSCNTTREGCDCVK